MTLTGLIVVFVIVWWLCFFVALPIGVRGQYEDEAGVVPGTEEAAPANPMLARKVRWATYGAAGICAVLFALTHLLDFEAIFLGT